MMKHDLRCMGTPPCFYTILLRGTTFVASFLNPLMMIPFLHSHESGEIAFLLSNPNMSIEQLSLRF